MLARLRALKIRRWIGDTVPSRATPVYIAAWCLVAASPAHASNDALATAPGGTVPLAFNTSFLHGKGRPADLTSVLASDIGLPAGTYGVEIQVNGDLVARRDIVFLQDERNRRVQPCLTAAMLAEFGVNLHALTPPLASEDSACVDVPRVMDLASVELDAGRMRLDLSIPQAFLSHAARGYVDPALWDQGVAAGYVNYQLTGNYGRSRIGGDTQDYFLGLQNGINIGAWRLRNESTVSGRNGVKSQFRSNRTVLERDVTSLKSQLAIGEQFSSPTLFDSVRFRGVQIGSDDAMLPDSERGYAPVIRGQALSNAVVEVRQGGFVLYRTNVPPGPFVLTDIFPSGSNGDLEIAVIEADGSRHVTRQAFSSLPLMVRKGRVKYSLSAGQYQGGQDKSPTLATGSLVYGLADNTTVAGGFQVSPAFRAFNLGIGTNTPIGALSLDVTQSFSQAAGRRDSGQSVRLLYAKTFTQTDTNLTLAAYRYSTQGYRTFSDHVEDLSAIVDSRSGRSRSRIDLTTSQPLGGNRQYGSVYLNLSQQTFWNQPGSSRSMSIGYGNSWRQIGYNLSFEQTRDTRVGSHASSTRVMVSLSIPLGKTIYSPRTFTTLSHDSSGANTVQTGLNGHLDRDTSYSLQGSAANQGRGAAAGASISHKADIGEISASYSHAPDYQSASIGATGAIVVHRGGVNLGPTVGDTFALIKVEGAKGAAIGTESGVTTGRNGYAVVPYAQPYRINTLRPDTSNLGADIELSESVKQVAPRRGAIVEAVFDAQSGRRAQFALTRDDGEPVPFGAIVADAGSGQSLGMVDRTGNALVLLKREQGELIVKWTQGQCRAPYALPAEESGVYYVRQVIRCR